MLRYSVYKQIDPNYSKSRHSISGKKSHTEPANTPMYKRWGNGEGRENSWRHKHTGLPDCSVIWIKFENRIEILFLFDEYTRFFSLVNPFQSINLN